MIWFSVVNSGPCYRGWVDIHFKKKIKIKKAVTGKAFVLFCFIILQAAVCKRLFQVFFKVMPHVNKG